MPNTGHRRTPLALAALLLVACSPSLCAGTLTYTELPKQHWQGKRREVHGLRGERLLAIGCPKSLAGPLVFESERHWPAGLYRLRVTLRPSHTCDTIAWHGGLRAAVDEVPVAEIQGIHFTRVHQAETKTITFVHEKAGPLVVQLEARVDPKVFEQARIDGMMKAGGPALPPMPLGEVEEDDADLAEVTFIARPSKGFYYVLERAELAVLSRSGYVSEVVANKIRYDPGETLTGHAIVRSIGGRRGRGTLSLYLEHDVDTRIKVKQIPVELLGEPQTVDFELPLPKRELGYALIAAFTSSDGADYSEAADYFNIADNFYRVAIFAAHTLHHGYTIRDETFFRKVIREAREDYANCMEFFAWAEDDMVEMSSEDDYWFSGQTCYQQSKEGLKKVSEIAHANGIGMVTYGKFLMTGYPGWKTAYDYPSDHKFQYTYAPGMWAPVNVRTLDRLRYKEFVPLTWGPSVPGGFFKVAWQMWPSLRGIRPDLTPQTTRLAAEEVIRSIEMFGWDGIRWDGHMAAGWAHGGRSPERYKYRDARETQTLVRYFKDIVNAKHPRFRHGYNYLDTQAEPNRDWAYEDFELDELARGGGLLMNESVKMAATQSYEWIARNLQVQGDLARERDGFLLFCSFASASERDRLAEKILYFAGGARTYFSADCQKLHRYVTRYSRYCFDETLRRLAKPEAILRPDKETSLWWEPFVYETTTEDGREQLVVNLINLPRAAKVVAEHAKKTDLQLSPGTDPFEFAVTLPEAHTLTGAHLIDPFTLAVSDVDVRAGSVPVPSVNLWSVLILDLAVHEGAAPLADRLGPPKTFGVERDGLAIERTQLVTLDIAAPVAEANQKMSRRFPHQHAGLFVEPEELKALSWEERNKALLRMREQSGNRAAILLNIDWWKGGALAQDIALRAKEREFGDLTPKRDGVVDVYYARNMMDYRLRLYESFACIDRFGTHESLMAGQCLRAGTGHVLENGIGWRNFPGYDVLVYVDIPHCAIGVENSYALVEYVKAGGAAFFTGGEYAFGKGVYQDTVLDRELLPVLCVDLRDTRYSPEPLPIEPGKDFGDLGVNVDFADKPAFWCWNEVALREHDGVRVFLKSGNRPILVGWQLGKGRVACLLTTHRGRSDDGVTAFFDWKDWPRLQAAVLNWLAPSALEVSRETLSRLSAEKLAQIQEELEQRAMGDLFDAGADPEKTPDLSLDDAGTEARPGTSARSLDGKALSRRIALLRELLRAERTQAVASLVAEQLTSVSNLPFALRAEMIDFVRACPPRDLSELGKRCLTHSDVHMRGIGYQLLAIAGDPLFAQIARSEPEATETDALGRNRYLSLAVALYPKDDLREVARERLRKWAEQEEVIRDAYTGGKGFSLAAPEQPCLDSESLFSRVGWLTYMARWEAERYAAGLAREWLMAAQYGEYCNLSMASVWRGMEKASPSERARIKENCAKIASLKQLFARLGDIARPHVVAVFRSHPRETATGFARAHFALEAKRCINFLGRFRASETRVALEMLKNAQQPLLARFAAVRLLAAEQR